jgi:heme/copper-type cytochrome/quinol oxidase subunit 3
LHKTIRLVEWGEIISEVAYSFSYKIFNSIFYLILMVHGNLKPTYFKAVIFWTNFLL